MREASDGPLMVSMELSEQHQLQMGSVFVVKPDKTPRPHANQPITQLMVSVNGFNRAVIGDRGRGG